MRELKFRAWDKDAAKYVDGVSELYVDILEVGTKIFRIEQMCPARYIIEQYTGLKDQYGKDIYEGDIIKVAESVKGYVAQDVEGRWIIFGDDRKPIEGCITLGELENIPELNLRTILATEYCSIIGNIHENQELLGDINVTNKEDK